MIARLSTLAAPALAKAVLVLGIAVAALLLLSGWLSYKWVSGVATCKAEAKAAIELATEQGKTQALAEVRETEAAIAEGNREAEPELSGTLAAVVAPAPKARIVYIDRVAKLPESDCGPGQEVMDATNALLRGDVQ